MGYAESYAAVRAIAEKIVAGDITPYRGAAAIWAKLAEEPDEYPEEFKVFVGLASEWQDHCEHRDSLETDIRDEAFRLLSGEGVD